MFFLLFSTYFEKIQLDFICNHLSIFNNVYHIKLRSEYMRYQRRQWHPLQYSGLENPMDGGAWWAAVHAVVKSWTRLSDSPFTFHFPALEKETATHSKIGRAHV